ncbi:hypothetical protein VTO73DRAFT_6060 [Trametes versicolor]
MIWFHRQYLPILYGRATRTLSPVTYIFDVNVHTSRESIVKSFGRDVYGNNSEAPGETSYDSRAPRPTKIIKSL